MLGKAINHFQTPRSNDVIQEDNKKALTYLMRLYYYSDDKQVLREIRNAKDYYRIPIITYEQFHKFLKMIRSGKRL